MGCEKDLTVITGFEDGGRAHKPRTADSLQKLEKSRKQILP